MFCWFLLPPIWSIPPWRYFEEKKNQLFFFLLHFVAILHIGEKRVNPLAPQNVISPIRLIFRDVWAIFVDSYSIDMIYWFMMKFEGKKIIILIFGLCFSCLYVILTPQNVIKLNKLIFCVFPLEFLLILTSTDTIYRAMNLNENRTLIFDWFRLYWEWTSFLYRGVRGSPVRVFFNGPYLVT